MAALENLKVLKHLFRNSFVCWNFLVHSNTKKACCHECEISCITADSAYKELLKSCRPSGDPDSVSHLVIQQLIRARGATFVLLDICHKYYKTGDILNHNFPSIFTKLMYKLVPIEIFARRLTFPKFADLWQDKILNNLWHDRFKYRYT